MPKRKKLPKIPDYTGISNNQVVQKSNPLQSLSETALTLSDLKILDAYLSRINSHDSDKRYVRFSKGELETLLEVERIRQDSLEKRLKNLFQVVTIKDPNKPKGFKLVALFEQAEAYQDDDGLWQVDLACSPAAMEYIFNIDNLGFLKYRLKNIVDLTSRYSYLLYLYLEKNSFRGSWEIDIDELKKILNCKSESYNQYKRFNDLILKKCKKEINAKTSIKYTYTPSRKKGRKYTTIKFEIKKTPKFIPETPPPVEENINLNREIWEELLDKYEFTKEQMEEIKALLSSIPQRNLPEDTTMNMDDIEFRRYNYINLKVKMIDRYDAAKEISDKFAYLIKVMTKDMH